jgi:penicillin-binding protein 1B
MKPFTPPDGVQSLRIDRATNLPADDTCPSDTFTAAFLVGTAPQGTCSHMGEDSQTLGNQLFNPPDSSNPDNNTSGQPDDQTKHRNIFQKMFGLGKDKQQQPQQSQPQPETQKQPQ